ncbi:MAG: hypothetical protein ACLFSK_08465 [Ectothiorhodospira sp.]
MSPDELADRVEQEYTQWQRTQAARESAGLPALVRLFEVAQTHGGQAATVRRFLLGLYNGDAWPMNLNDLRGLDHSIQEDVLAVLAMDMSPRREIHHYVEGAEALLRAWWGRHKKQ